MTTNHKARNTVGPDAPEPRRPARVLIECSPHRTTGGGYFPGLTDTIVEHESYLERYALATLVLCHDVHCIASQATEEPWMDGDRVRHHIPDFTVDCGGANLRLEVKALASLVKPEAIEKYRSIGRSYATRGARFAFLVDAQIEDAPRFASVKLLARYVSGSVPADILARATLALAAGPMTVEDLKRNASLALVDVWTLIACRHLCFDWALPLDPKTTLVSLPGQPFEGLTLANILCSTRFGSLLAELAMGRRPTNQSLLADAATWRQHRRAPGPWSYVGGFPDAEPCRDLREDERIPYAIGRKRNHAPGLNVFSVRRAN